MTKPYAVRFSAVKQTDGRINITHSLTVVVAASPDDALGKAFRMAQRAYPPSSGWAHHSADSHPADVWTEVDDWREHLPKN